MPEDPCTVHSWKPIPRSLGAGIFTLGRNLWPTPQRGCQGPSLHGGLCMPLHSDFLPWWSRKGMLVYSHASFILKGTGLGFHMSKSHSGPFFQTAWIWGEGNISLSQFVETLGKGCKSYPSNVTKSYSNCALPILSRPGNTTSPSGAAAL